MDFYKAQEMFEALKETIVNMIEASDWLDTISRQNALRKAKKLRSNIVSPDIYFNATFLEDLISPVSSFLTHIHMHHIGYGGMIIELS